MPVQLIGDLLASELAHMQPYIRFCSCQLNAAALLQSKTRDHPDFKDFLKVGTAAHSNTHEPFEISRMSICLLLSRRLPLTTAVRGCPCPASC